MIERWGRGIQKIINSCVAADDPEPEFFADEAEFKVIFRFPTSLKPPVYSEEEISKPRKKFTKRQQEILDILSARDALMVREIILKLKTPVSLRSLKRELLTLKTQGILGIHGHTNKAVWFVTKEPKEDWRTRAKLRTNSGQTQDKLRTNSGQTQDKPLQLLKKVLASSQPPPS